MKMTKEQRAGVKALAEFEPTGDNFSDRVNQQVTNEADLKAVARQAILDLLADLEEAERRNSSFRTLTEAQYGELTQLRSQVHELLGYKGSIESEHEANSSLTDQVERLESELASTRNQYQLKSAEAQARLGQVLHVVEKMRSSGGKQEFQHWFDELKLFLLRKLDNDILQSTIAEAVATAVEPYKRDAERYQWLCDVATEGQWVEFGGYTVKRFVDQSIDAARASQDAKLAAKEKSNG